METIKNYLETMFANLPHTTEVEKAKSELWQMMEDKYNELIGEGASDNEAVGTIISEFGNLDELAEELGITNVIKDVNEQVTEQRKVTLEEVTDFLKAAKSQSFMIAAGVFLCITSVVGPVICNAIGAYDSVGSCSMFIQIAIAVGLFVYPSLKMSKWSFLTKEPYSLDYTATKYIKEKTDQFLVPRAIMLTVGIILCIISFLPSVVLEDLHPDIQLFGKSANLSDLSGALLFIFVATGVFLIVYSSMVMGSMEDLLKKSGSNSFRHSHKDHDVNPEDYTSEAAGTIMSIYWPSITCIYLCWSFLTFDWHITWIIWPVASILFHILDTIFKKKERL